MKTAMVPLTKGFEDIEAITVIDVLRRGGVEVTTVSLTEESSVMSAHGVVVAADCLLLEVIDRNYDAIVLPGGPGTDGLLDSEPLIGRLRRQRREGGLVAAICAAPTVLARAGIVEEGVKMTCYPSCEPLLGRKSEGTPVVIDEKVITGQAPGSAMVFALAVLAELAGIEKATEVASGMVLR